MNKVKLLEKISHSPNNVRFADFVKLIESFGFRLVRQKGSHQIYERADIPELINIQDVKGKAKPYQIKQFFDKVERYKIKQEFNS